MLSHFIRNSSHYERLKKLASGRKILTYSKLKENAKIYLPAILPEFETDAVAIKAMHKMIMVSCFRW